MPRKLRLETSLHSTHSPPCCVSFVASSRCVVLSASSSGLPSLVLPSSSIAGKGVHSDRRCEDPCSGLHQRRMLSASMMRWGCEEKWRAATNRPAPPSDSADDDGEATDLEMRRKASASAVWKSNEGGSR